MLVVVTELVVQDIGTAAYPESPPPVASSGDIVKQPEYSIPTEVIGGDVPIMLIDADIPDGITS